MESEIAATAGTDWATFTREAPGMSAFALEDGVVYHTYSAFARGLDGLWGVYQWLDRAPLGRNESGFWMRRHDEYEARPEDAGSVGLGAWCVLSNPILEGRPQHLSAWAKEKLGWVKPAVIDPTVKQKLLLNPIEDSPLECFKVLIRPDGSEYYLLENRRKKGFDADLSAEGLLIWHVLKDRPVLRESHGLEGPNAPLTHLSAVPYPSDANTAFTPDTIPSSRSPLGGGFPVHITNILQVPDGRIAFTIGAEFR